MAGQAAFGDFASAVLIDTQGRFLLQQRDNNPNILHPGMIGLFGGHREEGETFLECIVREVREEISYHVPPEQFAFLGSRTSSELTGGIRRIDTFVARDIPSEAVRVTEGTLVVAGRAELLRLKPKIVPAVGVLLQRFLEDRADANR